MLLKKPLLDDIIDNLKHDILNVIYLTENRNVDINQLIKSANSSNKKIVGGIFPGLIDHQGKYDNAAIIQYYGNDSDVILCKRIGEENPGKYLDPDLAFENYSALVLVDGLSTGISDFLEELHEKYGNALSFYGGGCGSLTLDIGPCIFSNDGFFQDAALIVPHKQNVRLGIAHGWKRIAGPFVANKANKNVIEEINWQKAFDFYADTIKKKTETVINPNDFFKYSKGFPFGIFREGYEDVVRDPIKVNADGSIVCVGKVPANATLNILHGKKEYLIESARDATNKALANVKPESVFVVDCISRVLYLEDNFDEELDAIRQTCQMATSSPLFEGVLSLGEISSDKEGYIVFFNKTIVVTAICEK